MVAGNSQTIGRYTILEDLGAGGFASVYLAHDPVLDREVALKVLHPHLARDTSTRERFVHEGRALAKIRHPNIVQVFDAGEADRQVYLAMELVEGTSLADMMRARGRATLAEVVEITDEVASALAAVHSRGLVHCDVKPANVMIERETGRVVLLDLGVSRRVDDSASTSGGWLVGTPAFMAPEQVAPGRHVTPQTDLYQLGATVHAMLTGEPPFTGEPTQVMFAVVHHDPPSLADLQPGLNPGVAALVSQAMAKEPTARPAGPLAFASRLRELAGMSPLPTRRLATPGTPVTEAATQVTPRPPTRVVVEPAERSVERGEMPLPTPQARQGREGRTERIDPSTGPFVVSPGAASNGVTQRVVLPPRRGDVPDAAPARRRSLLPLLLAGALALVAAGGIAGAVALRGGDDAGPVAGPPSATTAAGVVTPAPTPPAAATPSGSATAAPTSAPAAVPSPSGTPAAAPSPTQQPAAARTPQPTAQRTAQPTVAPTAVAPPPPPPPAPPPAPVAGGAAGLLRDVMAQRGYAPSGPVVAVPLDGSNTVYVQRGDASDGQRLFLLINDTYLGTDWVDASPYGISDAAPAGPGRFSATYLSETGAAVPVTFTWNGRGFSPNAIAPGHCLPGGGC